VASVGLLQLLQLDGIRLAALSLQGQLVDLSNVDVQAGGFSWNPDGHRLLIGTGGDRFVVQGDPKVLICDVWTAICVDLPRPAGNLDVTPTWSPDGRFVVFARGLVPSPSQDINATVAAWQNSLGIWIARSDGTGQQVLDTPGGSYPTWSDDGRTVSFVHAGHRWRHDLYSGTNADTGVVAIGVQGRGWITY
jgi:Tol biopolymer transport system component